MALPRTMHMRAPLTQVPPPQFFGSQVLEDHQRRHCPKENIWPVTTSPNSIVQMENGYRRPNYGAAEDCRRLPRRTASKATTGAR